MEHTAGSLAAYRGVIPPLTILWGFFVCFVAEPLTQINKDSALSLPCSNRKISSETLPACSRAPRFHTARHFLPPSRHADKKIIIYQWIFPVILISSFCCAVKLLSNSVRGKTQPRPFTQAPVATRHCILRTISSSRNKNRILLGSFSQTVTRQAYSPYTNILE